MRKLLINLVVISSVGFAGCSSENRVALPDIGLPDWKIPGVYSIPVRQGNLITQRMVNELKPGMSKQQVRFLLGTPLLIDTFHNDRWDYLYTHKPSSQLSFTEAETEKKRLELHFENDRLRKIIGDMYPQGEELAKITRQQERERTIVIPADAPRDLQDVGFIEGLWNTVRGKDDKPVQKVPEVNTDTDSKSDS